MASGSRQKTTMAKLNRERAVRERRERKQARKDARRRAAPEVEPAAEAPASEAAEQEDAPLGAGSELSEPAD
jgi:hypothetical protein